MVGSDTTRGAGVCSWIIEKASSMGTIGYSDSLAREAAGGRCVGNETVCCASTDGDDAAVDTAATLDLPKYVCTNGGMPAGELVLAEELRPLATLLDDFLGDDCEGCPTTMGELAELRVGNGAAARP
jgi:hypothetical protein